MSAVDIPKRPQRGWPRRNRLDQLVITKPETGPPVLLPHHLLLIEYMTHGCPHANLLAPYGYPVDEPLSVEQAADVLRMRRRYARLLVATPIVSNALAKAVSQLRSGAHAKAVHRMIKSVDREGAGTAADAKIQLTAAAMVMGEAQAGQSSVHVNVAVVTPGYVIELPPDDDAAPPTIDATANPIEAT